MTQRDAVEGGVDGSKRRRGYHHGSVPLAALAVTRELVVRLGHAAVTMRDVATALGVAPSALYRHFQDRVDLLLALADEVHAELLSGLRSLCESAPGPRAALESGGHHFLEFASAQPQLFLMMYDNAITGAPDAQQRLPALQGTYRLLSELAADGWPALGSLEVHERMIGFWSTLFGYASVRARGLLLPYMLEGLQDEDLARGVVRTALGAFDR